MKTELAKRKEEFKTTLEKTSQALAAIEYLKENKSLVHCLDKMKAQHQDPKLTDKFTAGGCRTLLAKIIAGKINKE